MGLNWRTVDTSQRTPAGRSRHHRPRTPARWVTAAGAGGLLLAACGGPGGSRSSAALPLHRTASSACAVSDVSANGAVTANDLVALSFTSATEGVALVAGGPRRCSVRMAVSHDGGSSWKATGTALWANAPTAQAQVVAVSARHVWASRPDGPLLETRDGGRRWDAQPVPTPVEQLAVAGGTVWALSCPPVGVQATNTCAPIVERQPVRGGAWRRVTLPVTSVLSGPACRW